MSAPLPSRFYRYRLVLGGEVTEADVIPAPGQTGDDVRDMTVGLLYPGRDVTVDEWSIQPRPH